MICIIPARGGSKRIPGKNIKSFLGLPILYYPVKTAIDSGLFDSIIVSTEDWLIKSVAKSCGATVHDRSAETATDEAETEDVISEVLSDYETDMVCVMYPTSVFVRPSTLVDAAMVHTPDRVVFSVSRYPAPVSRSMQCTEHGMVFNFDKHNANSQNYSADYYDAGQFYMFTRDLFLEHWPERRLLEMPNRPYFMRNVIDINEPPDWAVAEKLYEATR